MLFAEHFLFVFSRGSELPFLFLCSCCRWSCPLPVPRAAKNETRDGRRKSPQNWQVLSIIRCARSLTASAWAETASSCPDLDRRSSLRRFKRAKFSFIKDVHGSWGFFPSFFASCGGEKCSEWRRQLRTRFEWGRNVSHWAQLICQLNCS